MADEADDAEKTEDPSQRKLEKAREKGDVAKSQEVTTWFMMVAGTVVLYAFSGWVSGGLADRFATMIGQAHLIPVDGGGLRQLAANILGNLALFLGLPLAFLMVAAVAGNAVQHGFLISGEPIKPKLQKISPIAGLKRLFSGQSLFNFAKGILKLLIVGAVMTAIVWPERDRLDAVITGDLVDLPGFILTLSIWLLVGVIAILTVVAGLDYVYTRHTWHKKQRMSVRELKEEFKQAEGDPHIKGKLRQIRLERSRRRMMQAVPASTVVITNPTHFAVALKYDSGMGAPVCVAKGTDRVALKIREVARDAGVPVIENPPLARSLYASVDLDGEIRPEDYRAVAEVIGFVMQMRRKRAW